MTEQSTEANAKTFFALFQGNPDFHYVREKDKTPAYQAVKRGIVLEDVDRHLSGLEPSLLSIPIDQSGLSHFAIIDVDAHDDPDKGIVVEPVNWVALAKQITELKLPLVVCRSKSGKGAWLCMFFKEKDGFAAADARRLMRRYVKVLGITNEVDFFPRQDEVKPGQQGNGVNLPYFGGDRIAFGKNGEELDLAGFLSLAEERSAYGSILKERDLSTEPEVQVTTHNAAPDNSPLSKTFIRRQYEKQLDTFRAAPNGQRNQLLNNVCFFAARAFASGALVDAEDKVKDSIRQIALGLGIPEHEFRATAASGWTSGLKQPFKTVSWQGWLRTGSQLERGSVTMYVDQILPEGITAIGSLSGVGKTWFALSMARALCTGTKFLKVYDVVEQSNVVYLVPEMGDKAVRRRIEQLKLPMNEGFYCQTVSDGATRLNDPRLEDAIAELKPIVFLDTIIRFNPAADENAARQNAALLAANLMELRRWGAKAVVFLHHSPKSAGTAEFMTLENVLRGTGDLGAMCDAVWGLQHARRMDDRGNLDYAYVAESRENTRLMVCCVKPRDFDPARPFMVQGRPYIDLHGDLAVLELTDAEQAEQTKLKLINDALEANPNVSINELRDLTRLNLERVKRLITKAGWQKANNSPKSPWVRRNSDEEYQENLAF